MDFGEYRVDGYRVVLIVFENLRLILSINQQVFLVNFDIFNN